MITQLLVNAVMLLVAVSGCLLVGGLMLNDPPLGETPGFWPRLRTYLTTNVAETRAGHPYPELELRVYRLPDSVLLERVQRAVDMLGWKVVDVDLPQRRITAVVSTRIFRFRDDVEIVITPAPGGAELHVRSASRIGRGDLGANTRHILDLYQMLAQVS